MTPLTFQDGITFVVAMLIVCAPIYAAIRLYLNASRGERHAAVPPPQAELPIGRFIAVSAITLALMACWSRAHQMQTSPWLLQILYSCLSFGMSEMLVDHWLTKRKKTKPDHSSPSDSAGKA